MAERAQRRLAAIIAADVAGYSRLIGEDEEGTLLALKAHRRELIEPLIVEHGGRIANTAGDSLLLEFPSAVDAVRCALSVQRGMGQRNASIVREHQIRFRIGINVGDVVAEGEDLLGDGVNIASRVEGLADPGGVAISDDAYRQVRDRLDVVWADGSEHEVKNIARPIRVWRWSEATTEDSSATSKPTEPLPLPDRPSIAVLPFENMSGDPGQQYFSDGITEDIITELSRYPDILVIARNSAFKYRDRSVARRQVAEDLGVRFVLEGSVRRAGGRVRVAAQLIDGASEAHVWAERYDRDLDDIFAVQDEITAQIASALGDTIHADQRRRIRRKNPANLDAYDKCLQALPLLPAPDRDNYAEAQQLAEEAVALDPGYGQAHAIIALTRLVFYTSRWTDSSDAALHAAYEAARRAVASDDHNYMAHAMLGYCLAWQRRHDLALASLRRAVALNPNDAFSRGCIANVLVLAGQSEEALGQIEIAMRLDPHGPASYPHFKGRAYFTLRRYEEAERAFAQGAEQAPGWPMAHWMLAATMAATGKMEAARAALDKALEISPDLNLSHIPRAFPYRDQTDLEHVLDLLRQVGLLE